MAPYLEAAEASGRSQAAARLRAGVQAVWTARKRDTARRALAEEFFPARFLPTTA